MNPKLTLTALVSALGLAGCYYPYGYYPAYPAYPVVGGAYTQQEVPVGTQGSDSVPPPPSSYTTQQYAAAAPPVARRTSRRCVG